MGRGHRRSAVALADAARAEPGTPAQTPRRAMIVRAAVIRVSSGPSRSAGVRDGAARLDTACCKGLCRPRAPKHPARRRRSDVPRAARGFAGASARRRALRTSGLTAVGRAGTGVASARSAAGGAGCSLVAALRRLGSLEPRSQIGDFPAQLGDLSALVNEVGGEAAQREAESLSAMLGADSRQVRLVVSGHVAVSRSWAWARLCPPACLMDAQCIGRHTLELDFKLPLLGLEHDCEPSRCIRPLRWGGSGCLAAS